MPRAHPPPNAAEESTLEDLIGNTPQKEARS